jgi:hypothetical protein
MALGFVPMKNVLISACERGLIPLIALLVFSLPFWFPQSAFAQSPLQAPGGKIVTVGSEIKRGSSEMSGVMTDCESKGNLVSIVACMEDVLRRNTSRNTDSDGFVLGALFSEWSEVATSLKNHLFFKFTSEAEIALVAQGQIENFRKVRNLQKKFGIDDDALLNAAGFTEQGETKLLMAKYDAMAHPAGRAAPPPPLQTVRLTQSVTVPLPNGNIVLNPGTELKLIARDGAKLQVRYMGADYEIPTSATDLK